MTNFSLLMLSWKINVLEQLSERLNLLTSKSAGQTLEPADYCNILTLKNTYVCVCSISTSNKMYKNVSNHFYNTILALLNLWGIC